MIHFTPLHPRAAALLGYIPQFLSHIDPRSAREQLDAGYAHGGGWNPMSGWRLDPTTHSLTYPGDPPLHPIAHAELRDEQIFVYPHAWVVIISPAGDFEVARMD